MTFLRHYAGADIRVPCQKSGRLGQWCDSNRGALVLEALLRSPGTENAKAELRGHKAQLKKLAKPTPGCAALLKAL